MIEVQNLFCDNIVVMVHGDKVTGVFADDSTNIRSCNALIDNVQELLGCVGDKEMLAILDSQSFCSHAGGDDDLTQGHSFHDFDADAAA